jgi:hypothetical protein
VQQRLQNLDDLQALFSFKIFVSIIILIVIFATILKKTFRKNPSFMLLLSIFLGTFTYNVAINNSLATYQNSTRYYFGETGFDSTCDWILNNIPSDQVIFAPKDIGLQSGHKYLEDALLLPALSPEDLLINLKNQQVRYVVLRNKFDYSPLVFGLSFDELRTEFSKVVFKNGDFEIWEKPL